MTNAATFPQAKHLFIVKMGGANNTDEITAALGFPFNDWIRRVPLSGRTGQLSLAHRNRRGRN